MVSYNNEKLLSQVLDRYIMHQKTLVSLTVHKGFPIEFENLTILSSTALRLFNNKWPEDAVPGQEPDNEEEASDDDEPLEEEQKHVASELFENTTAKALAESLELEGQGQQRHWVRQHPENCCYASFKGTEGRSLCGMTNQCLYCSAKKTVEMDAQYGLFQHYSVATLNFFAKKKQVERAFIRQDI